MAAATIRALNRVLRNHPLGSREDGPMDLEEFVRRSYRIGNADVSDEQSHLLVAAAVGRFRLKHRDYDQLREAMNVVACGLHPFWAAISLDEFLEALYCTARFADFMRDDDDRASGNAGRLQ